MDKPDYNIKEYSLVYGLSGTRKKTLRTVFENFDLDGLKDHFEYWKYAALVNDIALYEGGKERRLLIDFCQDVMKVFEAFYILNKHKKKQLKRIPAEYKKIWKKHNRCTLLTEEEKQRPEEVISAFSQKHQRLYALAEMVEMLECVITLENGDRGYLNSAVTFFMCVNALLNFVYS